MLMLFLSLGLFFSSTKAQKKSPNIIVIVTDDQAYHSLRAAGNDVVKSPNLDALIAEGLLFHRHYSTTAICMASRATLLTGKLEYRTGTNFMHGSMARELFEQSYPALLRQAGYKTAFAGKFGLAVTDRPDEDESHNTYERLPVASFDRWLGGTGQTSYRTAENQYIAGYATNFPHSTRAYGQAACDFIESTVKEGTPFCLSLYFKAPHMPFTPDPVFDSVYNNTVFVKPPNYGKHAAVHLPVQSRLGRQNTRWFSWWNEAAYQESSRKYYQLIYGVDYVLGQIREKLALEGVADNTVIIYTSDNGYNMGAHGFGDKVLGYEEGTKVPLVIYDPIHGRLTRGRAVDDLTGNIDIAPTILDIAGVNIPDDLDGISLLPLVRGEKANPDRVIPLLQAWGSVPTLSMGIVRGKWKYLYWPYAEGLEPAEELYNLNDDRYELYNLVSSGQMKKVVDEMRSLYDREVTKWKEHCVSYHHYPELGYVFDRHISWKEKLGKIPEKFFRFYENDLKEAGIESPPYDYGKVLTEIETKYH